MEIESVPVEKMTKTMLQLDPLTEEELDAVTVVFHQYETGLREGTIMTRVSKNKYTFLRRMSRSKNTLYVPSLIHSLINIFLFSFIYF